MNEYGPSRRGFPRPQQKAWQKSGLALALHQGGAVRDRTRRISAWRALIHCCPRD